MSTREVDMHTPGSAANHAAHHQASQMHQAAHQRAHDMHRSAHQSGVDRMRRSAEHDRMSFGPPSHGSVGGVAALVQLVLTLVLLGAVAAVVLLVFRPAGPEWLQQVVDALDGFVQTVRGAVS